MKHSEIREFANRNWTQLSEFDRAYWATEYRQKGFIATQKASLALWQHMKSIRPEWPDTLERQRDLDNHIRLKQLLDRNADALSSGSSLQRS